ncbi:MAG: transketolase [Candidatus Bathyarchaeia archaeon]
MHFISKEGIALSIGELAKKAQIVRCNILRMVSKAGTGHIGPSLSIVDILVVLYFSKMRHRPEDPSWEDRDRLILCKGHAAPALYAVLAEAGYFPKEELLTLRKFGSRLQGHPSLKLPGIDAPTGSLGQGLSIANGMALAAKLGGKKYRIYALLGDGECDEGQIWEAAMTAAHYKLDNITAIIDRNSLQSDGPTEIIKTKEPLSEKWRAFGWAVIEIDGNDLFQISMALDKSKSIIDRPSVIIARTVKGKGVPFIEGDNRFHSKLPTNELLEMALRELSNASPFDFDY